jgi:hypothetical protein
VCFLLGRNLDLYGIPGDVCQEILRIPRLISATIYAWFYAWQPPAWFWVKIINSRLLYTAKSIVSA